MDIEGMRRVDHAGEWGAVHIYKGQAWILPNDPDIKHMLEQEKNTLRLLTNILLKTKHAQAGYNLCGQSAAFALGAATALMGRKMAHTCTVAVEEVIEEHYGEQLQELDAQEPELAELVEKFAAEEAEHRNLASQAINHEPYPIASKLIRSLTRASIAVAKRILNVRFIPFYKFVNSLYRYWF